MLPPERHIVELLRELGLAELDLEPMRKFRKLLTDFNSHTNLTRIISEVDYWLMHVYDSILLAKALPEILDSNTQLRVADVGCGGGLPLIVLAWLNPSLRVTGIEARSRKTNFIQSAIDELGLYNADILTAQAREAGRLEEHADSYDIVTMRAVGTTGKMLKEIKGLLKPHAKVVNFKTPVSVEEEMALARREADKLKMTIKLSEVYSLPENKGQRQFVILER